MSNTIRVSGLGSVMEFDLRKVALEGVSDFYNTTDLDSDFCYVYPDLSAMKRETNSKKYEKTLREYRAIGADHDTSDLYVRFTTANNTVVSCTSIRGVLELLSLDELIRCGIYYLTCYKHKYFSFNSKELNICRKRGGLLNSEQALEVYSVLHNKYSDDVWMGCDHKDVWLTGFKLFRCLQKCLTLYVAKHLDYTIKESHCGNLYCEKVPGMFSSTFKVVLEFDGVKSVQTVTVKSANIISND